MPTFGEMQTEVSRKGLDPLRTDVSLTEVGTLINQSIAYYKRKPFWFNQAVAPVTVTVDSPILTGFPSDFLLPVSDSAFFIQYDNMQYPLMKISPYEYEQGNVETSGRPNVWSLDGGVYAVYGYPDLAYDMRVRYYKDYPLLVNPGDTNDFLVYADRLIAYDALSRFHAEYRQDATMEDYYTARAQDELSQLQDRTFSTVQTGRLEFNSYLI